MNKVDHSMKAEQKTKGMGEEKVNEIIVTFADYVENYYDEDNMPDEVPLIVNEHFDEFIDWAYDDFAIGEEERETLKGNPDMGFRDSIKQEVIQEFRMILGYRKYIATSG